MNRTVIAILTLAALIVIVFSSVTIRSDAGAVFGRIGAHTSDAINPSRDVIIGVDASDAETRIAAAKSIAKFLSNEPLIQEVSTGPVPPSQEFLDWIWDKRFQIAPPTADHFRSADMADRLDQGRDLFSGAEGMVIGDQVLLDPTGSFLRSFNKLSTQPNQPALDGGVWASTDGKTSLLFVTLSDKPFDASQIYALIKSIRSTAEKLDVSVAFLGARTIAAETTIHTSRASARASLVAGGLLILWLVFNLRSFVGVLRLLLPLGLGVVGAILITQVTFGYVHVIALGFGGALLGLALDYPIHLLGYAISNRRQAVRLVLLGALTTSLAFLAMLGSDIPSLVQTGTFVACGLMISALATVILPQPNVQLAQWVPKWKFGWKLPYRSTVLAGLAAGGLLIVLTCQTKETLSLFAPPPHVKAEMNLLRTKLALPSAQYTILVGGRDLKTLISNEEDLSQTLDAAIRNGALLSYSMVSKLVPSMDPYFLPDAEFQTRAEHALRSAGMAVTFAERQVEAYALARSSSEIEYDDLQNFRETRAIADRLQATKSGVQEKVYLFLPPQSGAPGFEITSPAATLVDSVAPVRQALIDIQNHVVLWLTVGAIVGSLLLAIGLKSWKKSLHIMRVSAATIGVTAATMVLIFGSLSIFQVLALALVVGIGVDYSLFIKEMKEQAGQNNISPSVLLCASSTLIAFGVLSFSGVQILQQVGMTVVVGLVVMLLLTLAEPYENS